MSVIRSLELVSSARDRNLYPNPAEFTVKVNDAKTSNITLASNPTTTSYPIKGFSGAEFVTAGFFGNISGPGTPAAPYLSSRAKPSSGYYNGMVLEQLNYNGTENGLGTIARPDTNPFDVLANITYVTVSGTFVLTPVRDNLAAASATIANGFLNLPGSVNGQKRCVEIRRPNYLNQLPPGDYFLADITGSNGAAANTIQLDNTATPVANSGVDVGAGTPQQNLQSMANVMSITGISCPIIRNQIQNTATGNPATAATVAITNATSPTGTSVLTITGTNAGWYDPQPAAGNFICIDGLLSPALGGGRFGSIHQVTASNGTSITFRGNLRLDGGALVQFPNADLLAGNVATITIKNILPSNLLYNGTGNTVFRDLSTNILKFTGVSPTAPATPAVTPFLNTNLMTPGAAALFPSITGGTGNLSNGSLIQIECPMDSNYSAVPLRVCNFGSYNSDGSNFVSFFDSSYLILDSLRTSPDGVLQNNFTTYNLPVAIVDVDPLICGWVGSASNFPFLIHKPTQICFTRCLDPNEKYSAIALSNPYWMPQVGGGAQPPRVTQSFRPANVAILDGNSIIETISGQTAIPNYGYFGNVLTQTSNIVTNPNIPTAGANFIPVQSTPGFSFSNTIQLPERNQGIGANSNATYTFPTNTPIGLSFSNVTDFSLKMVSNGIPLNSSPISDYNGNTGLATLETPFNTGNWDPPNTIWKINNDATILNANTILIQNGTSTFNGYANYYLDNLDHIPRNTGNLIQITSYDSKTKVATLEGPLPSATPAQEFYIRRELPASTSTTPGSVILTNVPTNARVQTAGTGYTVNTQFTNNATPELVTFAINVDEVDANGGIVRFTILYALDNQPIGTNITILGGGGNAVINVTKASQAVDVSVLTSPPSSSTVGSFVFLSRGLLTNATGPITAVAPSLPCTTGNPSHYTGIVVADYNAANVTALANNNSLTRLVVTKNNILPNALSPAAVVSGSTSFSGILEFLAFDGDTTNSLIFNASTITSAGQSCFQISLLDLILPNQVLDNEYGGIIAFYPYVYVELQNVSGPMGPNQDVIISNNINSRPAVFRATISDTTNPTISKFIKLSGSNSVSVMKFTPRDNLRFRVYFGNGETFKTLADDNIPPLKPNFDLQVSALFSIEKLK